MEKNKIFSKREKPGKAKENETCRTGFRIIALDNYLIAVSIRESLDYVEIMPIFLP